MKIADETVDSLLSAIGARTPMPGGGAVASLVAATGASLGLMVVNYSAGKKSLAEHTDLHEEAHRTLEELRVASLELADADARAYGCLNELLKLAEDDERRVRELPAAVLDAIGAPREVLSRCLGLLHLFERLRGTTNAMLQSDLAIAAIITEAAARSAAWNIRINLPLLAEQTEADAIERETTRMLERARRLAETVEEAIAGS